MVSISDLVGRTLVHIDNGIDFIRFVTNDGSKYLMNHTQSCCESVQIEDICGDLSDLLNSEIIDAKEITNRNCGDYVSSTYTFYDIRTAKGFVTIRWLGTSNGYYSEDVDFTLE